MIKHILSHLGLEKAKKYEIALYITDQSHLNAQDATITITKPKFPKRK